MTASVVAGSTRGLAHPVGGELASARLSPPVSPHRGLLDRSGPEATDVKVRAHLYERTG